MTKYFLISYCKDSVSNVFPFEREEDDLDIGSPYEWRCGFAVGSNQSIIKQEDATKIILDISQSI